MGKINQQGRSKEIGFIKLHRGVTGSSAWKSLNCQAKALLIAIWEQHNGGNNGAIGFSHRQARDALRIGNGKVQQAFRDLQDRGFIVETYKGAFDYKVGAGEGRASEWEITDEPCNGKPAKKLYKYWKGKQNTVPGAGTAGSYSGNRSSQNAA